MSQVRLVRGDSDEETAERVRDEQTKNQLEGVVNICESNMKVGIYFNLVYASTERTGQRREKSIHGERPSGETSRRGQIQRKKGGAAINSLMHFPIW